MLLGIFQDYQQKLFDEIRSVVADQQADIDQADLANMPYLDAFIKEALRFFPVVPVLTRLLKEDMQLGDACIPKGTEYIMDIWNMHRIKDNWKFDAQLFNPENFFPQNAIQRHPYSYIPYSAGPRNCIGNARQQIPPIFARQFAQLNPASIVLPFPLGVQASSTQILH